jgi:hypothetical protein
MLDGSAAQVRAVELDQIEGAQGLGAAPLRARRIRSNTAPSMLFLRSCGKGL